MMKKILALSLTLVILAGMASAAQVVRSIYQETFTANLNNVTGYNRPCTTQLYYETQGQCYYTYHCYAVQPQYSNDLRDAVQKECVDVTGQSGDHPLTVSFSVPRGKSYVAVSFMGYQNCTAIANFSGVYAPCYPNCNNASFLYWSCINNISQNEYKASALIGLCDKGFNNVSMMMKSEICYAAEPICIDPQNTHMCTNPYKIFTLDVDGDGSFANNQGTTSAFCTDRNDDLICDTIQSLQCNDINQNGICDDDDLLMTGTACVDLNQNFVCDNVETTGAFCQYIFEPMCLKNAITGELITFPNRCFADAAIARNSNLTNFTAGVCMPLQPQCYQTSDCPNPCNGISKACVNYVCRYSGACNPREVQCTVNNAVSCPTPSCKGVTVVCSNEMCVYNGQCITKPTTPPNFWDMLMATFSSLIMKVKASLGRS